MALWRAPMCSRLRAPIDQNGITATQVAGDDTLAFIYTYHQDTSSGTLKHLYAYSPASNTVTRLLDAPLLYAVNRCSPTRGSSISRARIPCTPIILG